MDGRAMALPQSGWRVRMMKSFGITGLAGVSVLAAGLGGCSTMDKTTRSVNTAVRDAVIRQDAPDSLAEVGRADNLGDALMTPATDLNIRKADAPLVLVRIGDPYANIPGTCPELDVAVAELDAVLGPDYDQESGEDKGRVEKTGLSLVSSAMGSLIPFRGVVREVTGAKKKERQLRELYRVGNVRRGYLKGVARERDCTPR